MITRVYRHLNADNFLRDSGYLFLGMCLAYLFNILFQMVVSRCLDGEEYALLIGLFGITSVCGLPLSVIGNSVSRYTSLLVANGERNNIPHLVIMWSRRMALFSLLLSLFFFLFPRQVADFFHLTRFAPIYVLALVVPVVFLFPVVNGALSGMQRFGKVCILNLVMWGGRLLFATCFVLLISPSTGWVVLSHGLAVGLSILVAAYFIFTSFSGERERSNPLPGMEGYIFRSLIIVFSYSVLMTGDVVIVKHLFPSDAPDFAKAATLGRMVIFIPTAFVGAMFPKVVSDGTATLAQQKVFIRTLGITFLLALAATLVFVPLTKIAIFVLYGISDPSLEMVRWSRLLAVTMIPIAVLNVFVRFFLAQKNFYVLWGVPLLTIIYLLLAFLTLRSTDQILFSLGVTSALSFLSILALYGLKKVGR